MEDWLAQANGAAPNVGTGLQALVMLGVGGLLASLLPCVYPLYPITAAVIGKRASSLGRFAHPLTYYLGLCGTYFGLGALAALSGGSFNEALRLPVSNLVIGGVLWLLALSTAGWLHFPVLSPSSGTAADSGLLGTLLLGASAGFLSSACVGPVVVGILLAIAAGTEQVSLGSVLSAAFKLLVFGMGVGLPLLLIGVLGLSLPKGGRLMLHIQRGFGLLIAWFAAGYVAKGLGGYGFSAQASWGLMAGLLLLGVASYLFQDAARLQEERVRRAVCIVVGVLGCQLVGSILGSGVGGPASASAVVQRSSGQEALVEQHGNLTWHLDKAAAYREALQTGRPVFVDFYADWCSNCKAFEALTLSDEALNTALSGAVLLKVRDTTELFANYQADSRFAELKVGLPFFIITDPKEALLFKTSDYTETGAMQLFLTVE